MNKSLAYYYDKYRQPFPPEVYDEIIKTFGLTKKSDDVLLNLGYGSNETNFGLADYFQKILAWDVDADALEIAAKRRQKLGLKNLFLEQKSEDEIDQLDTKIKLTIIASSMSSLDGKTIFPKLHAKLKTGGGVAIIKNRAVDIDDSWNFLVNEERDRIIDKTVRKYIKVKNKELDPTDKINRADYSSLLSEAGFRSVKQFEYEKPVLRSAEEVIGWLLSFPEISSDKFGKKLEKFQRDLKAKLETINNSGKFKENILTTLIVAKK
ncbi:MAG: class I SAM-dependent methyltransferase [Candidatus Nomurabacteria bacterium]|jgi:hypothetical protein|nr:class I SAM-dependent methyltransferase [Candidatus Nomurabacteria bacterium]